MKLSYTIASTLFLNLILFSASAQELVPPTDNYLQEAMAKSIQTISQEEPAPPNLSESKFTETHLRAPNSYIYDVGLAETNNYSGLRIPVKKAFDTWANSDWFLNQGLNENGQLSAYVYWEDIPGLIQNVGIEPASSIEDSKIRVIVNPKKGKGNAVVSLHLGQNGNYEDQIVWSWHIWVTDDPSQGVSYGQGMETDLNENPFTPQYMDRNLGATHNDILGDEWHKTAGLMYQWGRKDPIPPMVSKDFSFQELNGLVGYMRNREGIHSGNILPEVIRPFNEISSNLKFAIQNPIAYILNNDSGTWFSSQQYRVPNSNPSDVIAWDLWGDNMRGENSNSHSSNPQVKKDSRSYELKSPYDPCPNGWRIPSYLGRVTVNNNLAPWGRKNSGVNDDIIPANNTLNPHTENDMLIDVKIHSGLGIDFTDAHDFNSNSRNIGLFPTSGYYVLYEQDNGEPTIVYQDENAITAIWSATYSLGGARYLRLITDPQRPDIGEYGLNQVFVNQTSFSAEGMAVRCMKDPNLSLIGSFETEYIHSTKSHFTEGLKNPNSYIVYDETEMLIPVNKAFSAYENLFPEEESLPYTNLVANVYWTDNPDLVETVKLIGEGDPRQKFIRVQLNPGQKGNAVVSLHNGSVNSPVYWSWHIWAVADEIEEITYVNQEILPSNFHFVYATGREDPALTTTFMDRNLGAIHDLPVEISDYPTVPELQNEVKLSGGLHFQWGRKDPIPSFRYVGGENYEIYKGTSVDSNGQVSYSVVSQPTYIDQFTEVYSNYYNDFRPNSSDDKHKKADKVMYYSVQNPLTYLYHSTTEASDWISDEMALGHDRWGHGQEKSIFDPCPENWRVPDTFKVHENGKGSSPWFNGKKLKSLQGNPQFIGSHYGGEFFQYDNKAVGWFFKDENYQIGHFPTTGIIGKFTPNSIGGTNVAQAITGVWTAAMTQQLKGYALAMSIGKISGDDHKVISTGNTSPAYGLNVRCAKDHPRYEGLVGDDYFEMSTRDFGQSTENLKIYPNPVNDFLNISSRLELNIEIFNLQGQLVKKGKFENQKIDVRVLEKGIYIGLIYKNGSSDFTSVKIIKQ